MEDREAKIVAIDFSVDKTRALRIIEEERRTREKVWEKAATRQ